MMEELDKLAEALRVINSDASTQIERLAGRYADVPVSTPVVMQHAYKYIMYLRLMKGLDNATFHHMKRKYLNTSPDIQEECFQELNKLIHQDAINGEPSSAEIRRTFAEKLGEVSRS